jgi:hypothetical protein
MGWCLQGKNRGTRRKYIPLPISLRQVPNWMAWYQIRTSAVSVLLRHESKMEEETEGWWTELSHVKVSGGEDLKLCYRKRRKYPQSNSMQQSLSLSERQETLASCKTYRFITVLTTVPIPRQINSVQAPPPPISRRSHLMATYHLLLDLPTKTAYHFSSASPPPIWSL